MIFCLKKITLFSCLCILCYAVNGQENKSGFAGIKAADSLYNCKLFKQSSNLYFLCFKQNNLSKTSLNLFNAAKACSKAHYADSAYNFLFAIVKRHDNNFFKQIVDEPDFKKLHSDKRWMQLLSTINKQQNSANTNKIVGDEFIALRKNRLALETIKSIMTKQYGISSKKVKRFKDSVKIIDSINCYKWKSIINTYGWLGYKAIGDDGVQSEIYLYQNANIAFQKLHFPVIAVAFKNGDLDAYDYAVIADRISLYDTGQQIYGTQVRQTTLSSTDLFPVENKDSLNIRRQLIGLQPIP